MLDEVIITETPPLYCCYGHKGEQVCVPVTGDRAKRILHAALNIGTGDLLLLITKEWDALTHQYFLSMIRSHWSGWRLILFEDRGTPHTAEDSQEWAKTLNIAMRVKGRGVSNWPTQSIDCSAQAACNHLYRLTRHERLVRAGVLSGDFWLTN